LIVFNVGSIGNEHTSRCSQLYGNAIKTPPVGGVNCSSCGTLSEGAGVESGDEEKAGTGVDDGVEDGIDIAVGVNVGGGEILVFLD
jgi:hypothetical protein